jgi:hypothetical protein
MRKSLIVLLTTCCSFFSSQLMAADFLFQVPVKLEKIPKGIVQVKILCEVFSYDDNLNPIATGYTIRPINSAKGNLFEEIDVNVNYLNKYRHREPHQYQCDLQLLTPWAKPSWQTPSADSSIRALQPRENSQLVTSVSGFIQ